MATSTSPSRSICRPWINPALPAAQAAPIDKYLSYTQIDRNLSRWIIRYCPRIMVVGPELCIVVELGNIINLSLGFYVTVLSCTNINANSIFRKIIPTQPTVLDSFVGTVDANTGSTRSNTYLFFF